MLIRVDNETVVETLVNRLNYWTDDEATHELFRKMYESYVDSGCYEGCEFDVMQIVDNDYVNYCDVVSEGDDAYDDIKHLFEEQGTGDISCEHGLNHGYNFIEAEYDNNFLLRC